MAETKKTAASVKTYKLTADEEALKQEIIGKVGRHVGKVMEEATPHMIYAACALTVRDQIKMCIRDSFDALQRLFS